MNDHSSPKDELSRFDQLMMGALDNELSGVERDEFERLLAESPERRKEWAAYKELKELTMKMRYSEPPQEVWDGYWLNVYRRIERSIGWVLISIGAMVLLFYGGFKVVEAILGDANTPWFMKAGILTLMAGGVVLFVSVLREKLFTRKTDKYREIQR